MVMKYLTTLSMGVLISQVYNANQYNIALNQQCSFSRQNSRKLRQCRSVNDGVLPSVHFTSPIYLIKLRSESQLELTATASPLSILTDRDRLVLIARQFDKKAQHACKKTTNCFIAQYVHRHFSRNILLGKEARRRCTA